MKNLHTCTFETIVIYEYTQLNVAQVSFQDARHTVNVARAVCKVI